ALVAAGCATSELPEVGPRYHPTNIHAVDSMPRTIRRVALLPIAPARTGAALASGAEDFSGILETELRKAGMFEVVHVSESELRSWTGRAAWRADEALPETFFARVKQETGCDGVVFAALTAFRAYPPLALGLDLRLVAGPDHVVIWAVDEVIDAGSDAVARAAHDYSRAQINSKAGEDTAVLQSPRRFAQFASATLVATMPTHKNILKEIPKPTKTTAKEQP
ncbi:MAG TPA: hypothetical protein VK530_04085, partial [Candidatus Acidoferrum sp.]|nr:hypothetical protein [Candidatus Acidoferrum sp.]